MNKSSGFYQWLFNVWEHPWVFNVHQAIMDPGKGYNLRKFLRDVPYHTSIDIGCGTGNWAVMARGPYLGVDGSPSFIAGCKRRYKDDPTKSFIQADVCSLKVAERYDIAMLISVLHHLKDDEVARLVDWVAHSARYFLILDMYPIPWNPLSRALYAMDRGNYIRPAADQRELILRNPAMKLVKEDDFYSWTPITRHTLFLFESLITASNAEATQRLPSRPAS